MLKADMEVTRLVRILSGVRLSVIMGHDASHNDGELPQKETSREGQGLGSENNEGGYPYQWTSLATGVDIFLS